MQLEFYKKYEPLLKKTAGQYSRKFNLEYEELFGEACLTMVKAFNNYKKERAEFSTCLFYYLKNELRNFVTKEKRKQSLFIEIENYEEEISYSMNPLSPIDEFNFKGLEKKILQFMFDNSFSAEKRVHKNITRSQIKREFTKKHKPKEIEIAFRNIEEEIKNV